MLIIYPTSALLFTTLSHHISASKRTGDDAPYVTGDLPLSRTPSMRSSKGGRFSPTPSRSPSDFNSEDAEWWILIMDIFTKSLTFLIEIFILLLFSIMLFYDFFNFMNVLFLFYHWSISSLLLFYFFIILILFNYKLNIIFCYFLQG